MSMDAKEIEMLIRKSLPDADIKIVDLAGDGDDYSAKVTTKLFKGKTRVQQHKMVYDSLEGKMGDDLHALALQTFIPDN